MTERGGLADGGVSTLAPAAYAEHHGLARSGARPSLRVYAGQLWQRRYFISAYARARNAALFSESSLGQVWQVLTPLLNAAVYYFVFGVLIGTKKDIHNFTAFLVAGVFVFNYTQRAILSGSQAVTGRLGLVRALHFPRATLPLAATLMELQQLMFSMAILGVIVLATGEPLTLRWLLLVPALLFQTIFNAGMAFIFARLTTRIRDLQQLLPFMLRTLQYVSGVFYSIAVFAKKAPEWVRFLLEVNPAAVYIDIVRSAVLRGHPLPRHTWALALGWAVVTFTLGFIYFWRAEEQYGRG